MIPAGELARRRRRHGSNTGRRRWGLACCCRATQLAVRSFTSPSSLISVAASSSALTADGSAAERCARAGAAGARVSSARSPLTRRTCEAQTSAAQAPG